jgi:hypothetical protein
MIQTDSLGRKYNQQYQYLKENNEIISGACLYKNVLAMQHDNAFSVFEKLLKNFLPKTIVEIGTSHGGLTLFLKDLLDHVGLSDSKIRTFDVNRFPSHSLLLKSNIEIIYDNIFYKDYSNLEKPELLLDFLDPMGNNLVLCDGGNKIREFNLIAPLLRTNDIIMAHDYSPSIEYFQKNIMNKEWAWIEITDSDIHECCNQNNLKDYMQTDFSKVVWVCKQKIL